MLFKFLRLKKEPLRFWDYICLSIPATTIITLVLYTSFNLFKNSIYDIFLITSISTVVLLHMTYFNMRIANIYISLLLFLLFVIMYALYILFSDEITFNNTQNVNLIGELRIPLFSFIYLHIARAMYILATKNEPITRMKYDHKGKWHEGQKRKMNGEDLLWTIANMIVMGIFLAYSYKHP